MAPEQIAGRALTQAADWYAVGAILYEALAGRTLERGADVASAARPSALRDGIPVDMETLCFRLLDADPAKRPSSREIQALLRPHEANVAVDPAHVRVDGREGQLARLALAHEAVASGHAQCLFVSGAAGIGKTALLYERRADAAWERLDRDWNRIEKAHLLRMSLSRIDVLVLRATVLASLPKSAFEEARHVAECEAIARRLDGEERPDGAIHALSIRAVIAARRGRRALAVALIEQARRRYDALDMRLLSAVLERASGYLEMDGARVRRAESRFAALGVKEPRLFGAVFLPAAVS
jgi:hypothetical protein